MKKRNKREDVMCKMCLFYDNCNDLIPIGCFTPAYSDEDWEVETLIESNRISYRAEYFRYLEENAD